MTCLPTLERLSRMRVGVLGYGREGRSAVRALTRYRPDIDITVLIESGEGPTDWPVLRGTFDRRLDAFDVLLRSPGIRADHPALAAYRNQGGEIVNPSSIWFAERRDANVIGVTGSKGKSTTSALLAHLLECAGRRVLLAGNIGVPLLDHLETDAEAVVVELSSYQLVDLDGRLALGLITRLFPEHLDWHGSELGYFDAKLRIAELLEGRTLLVNAKDPVLLKATEHIPGRVAGNCAPGAHRIDDDLYIGTRRWVEGRKLHLIGRHNLDNAALAVQAGVLSGLEAETLVEALRSFKPLEHRLEPVESGGPVRWINDSIATSPHATLAALDALKPAAITLIVGGTRRPSDWQPVIDWCRDHGLQALITLPDNGPEIERAFHDKAGDSVESIRRAADLDQAVSLAADRAHPDSVVLLSPGAPSFPHFTDFEERGRRFREAVGKVGE